MDGEGGTADTTTKEEVRVAAELKCSGVQSGCCFLYVSTAVENLVGLLILSDKQIVGFHINVDVQKTLC